LAVAIKRGNQWGWAVKPDGTIVIVTDQGESIEPNPWLDDLKVTKQ